MTSPDRTQHSTEHLLPVQPPQLSIVIPCHNEELTVADLHLEIVSQFSREGIAECELEFIFIDDGSTDSTAQELITLTEKASGVRALILSRNFGKEAAMLAGLEAATGSFVAIMDGDLQHPPQVLLQMYRTICANPVDQVIARRTRTGESLTRRWTAKLYYRLINLLISGIELRDGIGDFRILTRKAASSILRLTERKRFSKGIFEWVGFDTMTISYENHARRDGDSSWTLRTLIYYAVDSILSFSVKPLRTTFNLGLLTAGASALYLMVLFVRWLAHGVEVSGYLTTIGAITLLSGVQLVTLGVIGEYIGAIYQEVKARPHYLLKYDSAGKDQWDQKTSQR